MFARRTESLDAVEIEKLINPISNDIFGTPNLLNIIERSLLSVTITSPDGNIIGYGSFYDYPNVSEIDCGDDFNKLVTLNGFPSANSLNSFFMHYFLARPEVESNVLMDMINTVFNTASNIHYIFLNSTKNKLTGSLSKHFSAISCFKSSKIWYGLKRESYMPTLYIRLAKPEDMDDLTPIFDDQSTILRDIYGEFYIAEMIAAQNKSTKCLVAEVGGYAIGFLSVTCEVDVDLLNHGYYIEPFGGFKKVDPDEELKDEINRSQLVPESVDKATSHTEHSVPVVLMPDNDIESSLSVTATEKTFTQNEHFLSMKSLSNLNQSTLPVFDGSPNALVIQMFAINEAYEMRSMDFLEHVFELFPKKDYLLITVPYLVPEFVLLDNFVRVTPRPGIILPHELYAFHKASLIDTFQVRTACVTDREAVEKMIRNMDFRNRILEDLDKFSAARRTQDGTRLFAYVAECMDQLVGIAIMKQEEDIEYIRSHYNIEDFIYFNHHRRDEHGHIKHFALHPNFKRLSKIFLKEVMRKSHKTSLYYPIYKQWTPDSLMNEHSLLTNLPDLVPVRPRRQIKYDVEKLEMNALTDRVLQVQEGYCLTHFNRKLVMEPKVTINARIVVVGASTTGLSFLESLVFCPHLKFNNLFLISPNGLPDNHNDDEFIEQLMGKDFYFSRKKLELSALRIQVHVIKGRMTAIDRKKKQITVNRKLLVSYDHMVIATGLQYAIPCPTEAKIKELPTTDESLNSPSRRYSETVFKKRSERVVPHNLLTINDPFDAVSLIEFVRSNMYQNESRVIVYGHSFDAYCCLHTLLALGIQGWRIHFIKPPPLEEENYPLNNPVIEEAVYQTLREAGVAIHDNYCVAQFNDSDQVPVWITSASFTTHGPPLRLECKLFISYYQKVVDYEAFRAINDSCLVFDARLVIDTFFHTNDVCIRGAGPITKFKRRYYNDQWNHSRFNSKAVGEELAKVVLRLFDPTLSQIASPPVEEIPLIPIYNDPIMRSCILPGGYLYLNVSKPSLNIPFAVLTTQANYGTVIVTGTPQSAEGYFRLHINQYKKIETITCLRRRPFPVENYMQLYGIHERALNNLISRFNEKLIKDLYEFLDDNWAMAFYHDRFKDLKEEIKELLMTRSSPCKMSFEESVRQMMADGIELSREQKKQLVDEFVSSNAKSIVDQRLISFVSYNYYHLPMYARPDMV